MASISFDDVSKIFPDGTYAVSGLTLDIAEGELMVLVGPSGSGKSTALRMVAGLDSVTEGVIRIGDRVVNHLPSRDRDIAMVFQSYALYPHLNVYDNIAFGLRVKKVPKDEIDRRVHDASQILGGAVRSASLRTTRYQRSREGVRPGEAPLPIAHSRSRLSPGSDVCTRGVHAA